MAFIYIRDLVKVYSTALNRCLITWRRACSRVFIYCFKCPPPKKKKKKNNNNNQKTTTTTTTNKQTNKQATTTTKRKTTTNKQKTNGKSLPLSPPPPFTSTCIQDTAITRVQTADPSTFTIQHTMWLNFLSVFFGGGGE